MKALFIFLIVVVVAASFYADYRWRQWIAARKQPPREDR